MRMLKWIVSLLSRREIIPAGDPLDQLLAHLTNCADRGFNSGITSEFGVMDTITITLEAGGTNLQRVVTALTSGATSSGYMIRETHRLFRKVEGSVSVKITHKRRIALPEDREERILFSSSK